MIDVRIDHLWHKAAYGIWIMERRQNTTFVAEPVPLKFKDAGGDAFMLPEPTLELRDDVAQGLFQAMLNEFARHGLRANNDKVAGLLEAQTKHLQDMRQLVFNGKATT